MRHAGRLWRNRLMVVLALMLVALGVVVYYTEGEHQEVCI